MPSWKMIALDLDHTLLNRNGQVSVLNREWLKRASLEGIVVTLVTGRHVSKVMQIAQELAISVPFATSNGCEIWSPEGELIQRICLSTEQVEWIHKWAKANRLLYRAYRADGIHDWDPEEGGNQTGGDWLKVLLKPKGLRCLNDLYREVQISDLFSVIGYDSEFAGRLTAIDLHPLGVSKAAALQALCSQLGIIREEVIAFGDDSNDIEMLRWAGLGVAMENASPAVHLAADRLAPHHDRDGVAIVLRELLY